MKYKWGGTFGRKCQIQAPAGVTSPPKCSRDAAATRPLDRPSDHVEMTSSRREFPIDSGPREVLVLACFSSWKDLSSFGSSCSSSPATKMPE